MGEKVIVNGPRMIRYQKKKRKRRRNMLLMFLLLLITVCSVVGFRMTLRKEGVGKDHSKKAVNPEPVKVEQLKEEIKEKEPVKPVNVAVFGVDNDGFRTDVNFIVSFNEETKDIHFVSVPRDTRVVMTEDMLASLEERNKFIPNSDGSASFTFTGEGEYTITVTKVVNNKEFKVTKKFII